MLDLTSTLILTKQIFSKTYVVAIIVSFSTDRVFFMRLLARGELMMIMMMMMMMMMMMIFPQTQIEMTADCCVFKFFLFSVDGKHLMRRLRIDGSQF